MNSTYDHISIGYGSERRTYPVVEGVDEWKQLLKDLFPMEHDTIDLFFTYLKEFCKCVS